MKKTTKRKPATVGEKLEAKASARTVGWVRSNAQASRNARRNDAAIGRAVKAERLRCATWAARSEYGSVSRYTAMKEIENGTEPE